MGSLGLIGRGFPLLSVTAGERQALEGGAGWRREPSQRNWASTDVRSPWLSVAAAPRRMFWTQGRVLHVKAVPGSTGIAAERGIN